MDMSGDEDMFAVSDEETSLPQTASSNPVEEHLLKQLADVQNRIDVTSNEIAEVKTATVRILKALQWRAIHGEDINSDDSDSDLYTTEGQPILKKKGQRGANNGAERTVEIVSQWQCVLQDKWIIGVELQNASCCTLINLRYYPYVPDKVEIYGQSMFWKRFFHWERIDSIHPGAVHVVATMVLDLPTFDRKSASECWGTISYEIGETQFQIPVPGVRLTIDEVIDCSKFFSNNERSAILALKSTSGAEKIVNVCLSRDDENDSESDDRDDSFGKKRLFRFLAKKAFVQIHDDVFLVKEHGSLMYCLIELEWLSNIDEVNVRIFARSVNQLNIILHFLRPVFPKMTIMEEVDDCVEAAMALIRELEMIRDKKGTLEIQKAKAITDLLIP